MIRRLTKITLTSLLTICFSVVVASAGQHEAQESPKREHHNHGKGDGQEEEPERLEQTERNALANIHVYKSPTCSCCSKWEKHLREAGLNVSSEARNDMHAVKRIKRVPRALHSCHTATIDGYLIEGHVPASDIKRLLRERPEIRGLAVPGMPLGSPGMEAARTDAYDVLAIHNDGTSTVYASYPRDAQ